ncbi:MAG: ribose-5-phosphate isomerase RpiA [Calditrichia bacterium]
MSNTALYKKQAAEKAVDYITDGMVVGLGTGTTAQYALIKISAILKSGKLKSIVGIPSSINAAHLAQDLGIPLSSLDHHPELDIVIDGADEVDAQLNLIKGGGGALLREKILAHISKQVIIVVDESKLSEKLGTKHSVPVEVLPFAWRPVSNYITSLGARAILRTQKDGSTYKTDQDNLILDCNFGQLDNPEEIAGKLKSFPGIIEHGLFLGLTTEVIVAGPQGIQHLRKNPTAS